MTTPSKGHVTLRKGLIKIVTILPSLVAIDTMVVEMFLVCHMISHDYVIKGSYDFIAWSLSR